jgi:hypothetical protein
MKRLYKKATVMSPSQVYDDFSGFTLLVDIIVTGEEIFFRLVKTHKIETMTSLI